jgi:RNA polymerase sigma factor (sigma-70 family)
LNDSDLVQGLRDRNPAAVQALHECYLPSLWRFVYVRVGGNRHLAEDILSETVLALIRAAAAPEAAPGATIGNVEGWLRSVAGNKVADHFRAAARVQHLIDQALPTRPAADDGDPVRQQEREEQRAEVRRVMDALPARHRLVLEWKYLDKVSVREIGERMQLTEKAVESVLFRARRDFRERLSRGARPSRGATDDQDDDEDGRGAGPPRRAGQDACTDRVCTDRVLGENPSSTDARIPVNTRDDTATP